jgi:hypothetical protein
MSGHQEDSAACAYDPKAARLALPVMTMSRPGAFFSAASSSSTGPRGYHQIALRLVVMGPIRWRTVPR